MTSNARLVVAASDLFKACRPVIDEEENRLIVDEIHENYHITLTFDEYNAIKRAVASAKWEL